MLHIGFTGTRHGMTPAQTEALAAHLAPYAYAAAWAFHHGDCQGADAEAHAMAWMLGAIVYVHPPKAGTWRAYCAGPSRVLRAAPLPYLQRNQAIVDACDVLIAAPRTAQQERRSGTWSTVRDAQKRGKPVIVLAPEAPVEEGAAHV
jgi:hypothetical protein